MNPSRTHSLSLGTALLATALGGCPSRSAPDASARPRPQTPTVTQPARPRVPPGNGARIVVDISESHQGFARARALALEGLHGQVLEASLASLGLNVPFERCALDEQLRCEQALTLQQLRDPATYRGRAGALDLALRKPPRAPRPDQQQADPLDPFRVTILVTDGAQSSSTPFNGAASGDVACTGGADPSCIAALLRQRIEEGYGVWVLRLRLPFNGRYFSERRIDREMFARTTAHIAQVNRDERGWSGVSLTARRPNFTGDSGSYEFSGARPLMLFVLSRDIPTARTLVAEMSRRARTERIGAGTLEDVAVSEWAPFDGYDARLTSATRVDAGGAADEVRVDRARTLNGELIVPITCSLRGRARVRVQGMITQGSLAPPPFADLQFSWRQTSRPTRGVALIPSPLRAAPGPFEGMLNVDCTGLPAGRFRYSFAVHGHWGLSEQAATREWWSVDNAPNSYEMPERVFGLGEMGRSVASAGLARDGALTTVHVDLTRE
ncbi:MAG: hypothetical protein Q8Q09_02000 [Deltaproteobacteria bacterium]|nr:hypothetical protein [Deltaproteobacteria bacterium]